MTGVREVEFGSAEHLRWLREHAPHDDGDSGQQVPVAPRALGGLGLAVCVVLVLTGLAFWAGTIIGILALIGVGV